MSARVRVAATLGLTVGLTLALATALGGCRPKAQAQAGAQAPGGSQAGAQAPGASQATGTPDSAARPTAVPTLPATPNAASGGSQGGAAPHSAVQRPAAGGEGAAAGREAGPGTPLPAQPAAKTRVATVREVLASGHLVGELVRVTGRCLGYRSAVATGTPPRTRSDWQLERDGVAVYVTGAFPPACSPTTGSSDAVTIVARVAEDTLPALGDYPKAPRRYLVRVD